MFNPTSRLRNRDFRDAAGQHGSGGPAPEGPHHVFLGGMGAPWGRVLRSGNNDERQDADPQQSQRMNVL